MNRNRQFVHFDDEILTEDEQIQPSSSHSRNSHVRGFNNSEHDLAKRSIYHSHQGESGQPTCVCDHAGVFRGNCADDINRRTRPQTSTAERSLKNNNRTYNRM
jgi:hypothetical protein